MASLKKSSRDAWWGSWQAYINKLRTAIKSYSSESEFRKVLKDCLDAYKNHLLVSAKDEALAVISGKLSMFCTFSICAIGAKVVYELFAA